MFVQALQILLLAVMITEAVAIGSKGAGTINPDTSEGGNGAILNYIIALILTAFILGVVFVCYKLN